jgi:sarcosine oxidase subunit alpha
MNPEPIIVSLNGRRFGVTPGTSVAAALAQAGVSVCRRSLAGEPRAPFCGMGICFECRVTVNGQAHVRSCLTVCTAGMEVQTDD